MQTVTIATRRSPLALWQTDHVADLLNQQLQINRLPLTTRGDQWLDRPLAAVGGKGLFLKELEHALLDGRADIAVHSFKDMPADIGRGLAIGAILPRATPWDAWVSNDFASITDLPANATVGTSSPRRQLQLRHIRPDLKILPVRGNVQTRLAKLDDGLCNGLLLACAGLERLGLEARIRQPLTLPDWLPAAAQGAIVVQCRQDDQTMLSILAELHCSATALLVNTERQVAAALNADCHAALAVYAEQHHQTISLHGLYGPDPMTCSQPAMVRGRQTGCVESADNIAAQLATQLQQDLQKALDTQPATAP